MLGIIPQEDREVVPCPFLNEFEAAIVGVEHSEDQIAVMRDRAVMRGRLRFRGAGELECVGARNPGSVGSAGGGTGETHTHKIPLSPLPGSKRLFECLSGLGLSNDEPLCQSREQFAFVDAVLAIVASKLSLGERVVRMYDDLIARTACARGIAALTDDHVYKMKKRYVRRKNCRREVVPAEFRELLVEVVKGSKFPSEERVGRPSEYEVAGLSHLLALAPPRPILTLAAPFDPGAIRHADLAPAVGARRLS